MSGDEELVELVTTLFPAPISLRGIDLDVDPESPLACEATCCDLLESVEGRCSSLDRESCEECGVDLSVDNIGLGDSVRAMGAPGSLRCGI